MAHHGRPARARHGLRLLGHGDAPQLADAGERRVRRPAGRQGRHDLLELPLHAGGRRPRHEPHAHARASATSSASASSACATPRRCSRSTSGATRPGSTAASPASTTCTSTTRAGSSPASSRTSPPTTCTTSRSRRPSTSPFFQEIRRRQPFNHNLLMPCMLIDNPHHSREIIAKTGAHPTHDGAETLITQLQSDLDALRGRSRPRLPAGLVAA